jgi:hypothetical protein
MRTPRNARCGADGSTHRKAAARKRKSCRAVFKARRRPSVRLLYSLARWAITSAGFVSIEVCCPEINSFRFVATSGDVSGPKTTVAFYRRTLADARCGLQAKLAAASTWNAVSSLGDMLCV